MADIAVHIRQLKRRSAGNFFLKRAKKYFFVSGPSNQRVDYMANGIKMSPKIPPVVSDGYVKYEKVEIYRSAIMQDFLDNSGQTLQFAAF